MIGMIIMQIPLLFHIFSFSLLTKKRYIYVDDVLGMEMKSIYFSLEILYLFYFLGASIIILGSCLMA